MIAQNIATMFFYSFKKISTYLKIKLALRMAL